MKVIKWYMENGMNGCTRSGEFEIDDDATEEEIEECAREQAFNFVSWGWEVVE